MSRPSKFGSSEDAKRAGWYSRRHRTKDSHDKAIEEHAAKEKAEVRPPNKVKGPGKRQRERHQYQ